jgi:transposase
LFSSESLLGLPGYEITDVGFLEGMVRVCVRHVATRICPHCGSTELRLKDRRVRHVRHLSMGGYRCLLALESKKWRCGECGRTFWQRFPGILPRRRASEPFRKSVSQRHWDGINRRRLSMREGIGSATVERWFLEYLAQEISKRKGAHCPRVLGIDEHFFSRRDGYATTFCDLAKRKVFDVVLGRSEASLDGYLRRLKGKDQVQVVCIDLSVTYRSLVRKHFPNARIVADRFHVIRVVNHHFLQSWRQIDPMGSKNRGLLSLMRRHRRNLRSKEQMDRLDAYLAENPALETIYWFKQHLCELLTVKSRNQKACHSLIRKLLEAIAHLRDSKIAPLLALGETLHSWAEEIATMWRFTKNNGITEGFHNKMEALQRQAYGFRNFQNYRMRVRVMCS